MKLSQQDLKFLKQLSAGARLRWADIGERGRHLAQGQLVQNADGHCRITGAGEAALQRAMVARLI